MRWAPLPARRCCRRAAASLARSPRRSSSSLRAAPVSAACPKSRCGEPNLAPCCTCDNQACNIGSPRVPTAHGCMLCVGAWVVSQTDVQTGEPDTVQRTTCSVGAYAEAASQRRRRGSRKPTAPALKEEACPHPAVPICCRCTAQRLRSGLLRAVDCARVRLLAVACCLAPARRIHLSA
jgi:hypothetical protein